MSLSDLELSFADEDPAIWVPAARELGARASRGDRAVEAFILTQLREKEASQNVHRFRHACCALASFLSENAEDPGVFSPVIETEIRAPLLRLTLDLISERGTVADLETIPGMKAAFDDWRSNEIARARTLCEKFSGGKNPRALEANQQRLAELENLGPGSRLPLGYRPEAPATGEASWSVASYLAGVRSTRALLGLPVERLIEGLSAAANGKKQSGLPLVMNLPRLLVELKPQLEPAIWQDTLARLEQERSSSWAQDRLLYNDYVLALSEISRRPFFELWAGDRRLPEWLSTELAAISESSPQEAPRRGARLMRRIAEECFRDDWRWSELSDDERFALNVYALFATRGVAPLRPGAGTLGVEHRLALITEAIEGARNAREHVLPALVRCLKLVLGEELRARKENLSEVCRRQIALVQPLVAEWRLPGTLRKDLAIIVERVLMATYRRDRGLFLELLYTTLYALPDVAIFRDVVEHSTEPEVSALVRAIVDLIEHWARARRDGGSFELYVAYAAELQRVAGDHPETHWARRLVPLARHLSRMDSTDQDRGSLDAVLLQLLVLKQRSVRAPALELSRSDRRGAEWAEREETRRIEQEARARFDRFQRVIEEVEILEAECLPERGRPKPTRDLVRRWRRLIAAMDELLRLASAELPYPERDTCCALLQQRTAELEARLEVLVRILEREEEDAALELVSSAAAPIDAGVIRTWMIERYMVRELARGLRLRVLGLLTSPLFVLVWIFSPFAAASILDAAGWYAWRGLPFALIIAASVVLLAAFQLEARGARKLGGGAQLLLPQIGAALFLGVMEVLPVDEAWSLAVLEYAWVRALTLVAFCAAGFFFTREVLLGDQLSGKGEERKKTRRAGSVMALALWQSFALVTLFGVLGGRVMAARAELDPGALAASGELLFSWLPHEVHLGPLFFQGAGPDDVIGYRIFPWALLTWTVQVFFFSVIFERIMRRRE